MAKESSGGGTAEFDLPEKLSDKVVFSTSNYYDQLTWSGFAVFNGSNSNASVNVTIMTTSGETNATLTIPAKSKVVNYFDAQFGVPFTDINSVIFSANSIALTGITISGKDNEKLLFTGTARDLDGWKTECIGEESSVFGIAKGGDNILAFCQSCNAGSTTTYMQVIRASDGLTLYNQVNGYADLYPMGLVSRESDGVVIAYGIDIADSSHPKYFVARVNPDDGMLMWQVQLCEADDPSLDSRGGFLNRICVATDGLTSVQANVRGAGTSFMDFNMLNVSDGSVLSSSRVSGDFIPTFLMFDSVSGNYYSIASQYRYFAFLSLFTADNFKTQVIKIFSGSSGKTLPVQV